MSFIVLCVSVLLVVLLGVGVQRGFSENPEEGPVTSEKIARSTRGEIDQMLKGLEARETPELKMGAMCYEMMPPAEYAEYVCPVDGEKTVFASSEGAAYGVAGAVVEMRRAVERLNTLTASASFRLDEKRLCHRCAPGLEAGNRFAVLVTRYPDGREHRHDRITGEDLTILSAFFEGRAVYEGPTEFESPLKEEIPRIRKILGLPTPPPAPPEAQ